MGIGLIIFILPGIGLAFFAAALARDLEIENYRQHSIVAFIFAILCTIVLIILAKNESYSSITYLGLIFLILPSLYSYAFTVGRG
mgnify:FL=1